jgi:hypothetical protein
MNKALASFSLSLAIMFATSAMAENPPSELAQRVAATGLEGGWAGTLGNVDACSILIEQWAVDGERVRYQARLVGGGQQPAPVFYEIISVDANRVTLSGDTVLIVDGDQLTLARSGQTRHRCAD